MTGAPTLTRPVSGQFIVLTLFGALMLNLLPWQGSALLLRPDFALLLLVYWTVHQPLRIGLTAAWILGLVMDVADGVLLGQHALAYCATIYFSLALHRRIRAFGLWPQALHVFFLLLSSQALLLLIHLISGAVFIGWGYFFASVTGALLWPLLSLFLQQAQKHPSRSEITYPPVRSDK